MFLGDLCRDRKQITNLKMKAKKTSQATLFQPLQFGKKDELAQVMERCKSSRKGEEFVREVCGAPDPRCLLVDDWQM